MELSFSEADYAVVEGQETMITILKNNPNVSPITLRIVPMTYGQYADSGGVLPVEIQNTVDTIIPTAAQCKKAKTMPW